MELWDKMGRRNLCVLLWSIALLVEGNIVIIKHVYVSICFFFFFFLPYAKTLLMIPAILSQKSQLNCQNMKQLIHSVIKQTNRQENVNKQEKMNI